MLYEYTRKALVVRQNLSLQGLNFLVTFLTVENYCFLKEIST